MKIKLPDVTLLVMHANGMPFPLEGLEKSMEHADFGDVLLLTNDESFSHPSIKNKHIPPIGRSTPENNWFNIFFIKELVNCFDTEFCMTVHPDGYIINPDSWTDEFLKYDYIGAPWNYPGTRFRDVKNNPAIGNGGFSLRSKKICEYTRNNYSVITDNEDKYYSNCAESTKPDHIKYPPVDLALQFSQETMIAKHIKPLGFHWHQFKEKSHCIGGEYWFKNQNK